MWTLKAYPETDPAKRSIHWAKCLTVLLLFTATPVTLGLAQGTEAKPGEAVH